MHITQTDFGLAYPKSAKRNYLHLFVLWNILSPICVDKILGLSLLYSLAIIVYIFDTREKCIDRI